MLDEAVAGGAPIDAGVVAIRVSPTAIDRSPASARLRSSLPAACLLSVWMGTRSAAGVSIPDHRGASVDRLRARMHRGCSLRRRGVSVPASAGGFYAESGMSPQSSGKGIPNCQRVLVEERRKTSTVRWSVTIAWRASAARAAAPVGRRAPACMAGPSHAARRTAMKTCHAFQGSVIVLIGR